MAYLPERLQVKREFRPVGLRLIRDIAANDSIEFFPGAR